MYIFYIINFGEGDRNDQERNNVFYSRATNNQ